MSKKGRARRTPERRIEAKDNRAMIAYLVALQRKVSETEMPEATAP